MDEAMKSCNVCRQPAVADRLDFGEQALTNRFLRSPDEPEYTHPLAIGVCEACGTVQLDGVPPAEEVRPRFEWLTYNEPESHLDDLAQRISQLPGLSPASIICGLSYKDGSTLRRLRERGFTRTWLADRQADLGIEHPLAGIESIQQSLTRATAERLAKKYGRPDVVLLRHVLEHSHDIHEVLAGLRELVAPNGYIVFEMPDAVRALERCDYSTVWEEHVFYFTPATLRQCFALTGFAVVFLESYYYTLENSLVAIVKPGEVRRSVLSAAAVRIEVQRMRRFIDRYPAVRASHAQSFERTARTEGKVALLGAGHLSAAFINLLRLAPYVDFVADDNPHKQGLFMPGSRVPILGSDQLVEQNVRLCLMTVRPEIEDAVARKNRMFTAAGGRLASIFPDSPYSLRPEAA
jgi:2-polyprenyl-3-methyl-5-hydroxy-6-metoxy-1,4-benzoquinol methylase